MIMIGIARALAYMHSSKDQVIHLDIKTSNILLDQDFNAKLGGFELARVGYEIGKTDITTSIAGTFGYLDLEYAMTGRLSAGSDIYSFGIVLLETLTGKSTLDNGSRDQMSLVGWASPLLVILGLVVYSGILKESICCGIQFIMINIFVLRFSCSIFCFLVFLFCTR